jgi:hypothetical protein
MASHQSGNQSVGVQELSVSFDVTDSDGASSTSMDSSMSPASYVTDSPGSESSASKTSVSQKFEKRPKVPAQKENGTPTKVRFRFKFDCQLSDDAQCCLLQRMDFLR